MWAEAGTSNQWNMGKVMRRDSGDEVTLSKTWRLGQLRPDHLTGLKQSSAMLEKCSWQGTMRGL